MLKLKIKFSIPGFHYWKNAPKQYDYLRNLHRHNFYWEIIIETTNDREIEIISFNDRVQRLLKQEFNFLSGNMIVKTNPSHIYDLESLYFGGKSCEAIAQDTYDLIKQHYNDIKIKQIAVLEDNENGAIKEWE